MKESKRKRTNDKNWGKYNVSENTEKGSKTQEYHERDTPDIHDTVLDIAPESVNNSITMSGSLDYYFEKAGDYYLFAHNGNGERNLEKLIEYDFRYQFELLWQG